MMALSFSAALSNCGCFSWLPHSEPCSLCPVGLGRNWYYLLQPQKKTSAKPWCDGVKCRHQQHYPPHRCSLFHIHHMLIYYIPLPHKRKRCRRALLPALSAGVVHDGAIDGPSESKKECSPTPLLLGPSELMKKRSPILLLLIKLAGVPHAKAIVGSSKN